MGKVRHMPYQHNFYIFVPQSRLQPKNEATGVVTLIQCGGSALKINVHIHTLFLDDAYAHLDNFGFNTSRHRIKTILEICFK